MLHAAEAATEVASLGEDIASSELECQPDDEADIAKEARSTSLAGTAAAESGVRAIRLSTGTFALPR